MPIFAVILVGWLAATFNILGPQAGAEINRLVVWLAMPALLFDVISKTEWSTLWQPGLIAVYTLSSAICIVPILIVCVRSGTRSLAASAIDAMNAGYPNVGFIGFPLALVTIGQSGLVVAVIGAIATTCIVFGLTIALVEIGAQGRRLSAASAFKAAARVFLHPMILAAAAAFPFTMLNVGLPGPVDSFLTLLGAAAPPCALVGLGVLLAIKKESRRPEPWLISLVTITKLVGQPVAAWILAGPVLGLDQASLVSVVLLTALPVGAGSWMLAHDYKNACRVLLGHDRYHHSGIHRDVASMSGAS
ncbi:MULTISPECIES: AEC family transporter [unclassified Rhizobium]|uniref:AEC family transporter n=1 Tax=unclassified Rhizobium TaxID=2613769 RepID=UPI001ADAE5E7|nr:MULTISPECIES: AEC family transporter [unclassified Rhizobium]MBO9126353.1 AEC family transporter [Rhizobium sp. 16-488-2b]MBO9176938.1 AEC family transporter [Rhizobium sp. 16-488-2a]